MPLVSFKQFNYDLNSEEQQTTCFLHCWCRTSVLRTESYCDFCCWFCSRCSCGWRHCNTNKWTL